MDEVKKITKDKEAVQTQLALKTKNEEKIKSDYESNSLKMKEAINETGMLRTICERQERELKQRDSSSRSDGVRLTRQDEQITKLKIERQKLEETIAVSQFIIASKSILSILSILCQYCPFCRFL